MIVAGLFTFLIAPFFSRFIRFFPPVVTGSVITIIGIALLPVAAGDATGGAGPTSDPTNGKYMAYALGTSALIVLIQRVFKGFMATVAVLLGLVIGTLVAWALGDAHFDSVGGSGWVGVTTPFHFGWPQFSLAAIISMIVVMLITAVETTGDVFATGEIVEKRVGKEDVARALRADGLATSLGGIFNSFPYTCFAENVGLVRLTQVKSRFVVAAAGVFMIVIGLVPKAGAIVAGIPHPVLGGAALAMFATVAVVGFQILSRVDFHDHRNVVIVATSVGLAMYVTAQPQVAQAVPSWAEIILGSGITLGSITAIVLNIVFHHIGVGRGPAVAGQPGDAVRLGEVNEMKKTSSSRRSPASSRARAGSSSGPTTPGRSATPTRCAARSRRPSSPRSREEQRQLIEAYPELGSRMVADGLIGEESFNDQSARGLTRLGDTEHEELAELTEAYRERFGFPLVVSVRDADSFDKILEQGRARLDNCENQEHAAALIEIAKIAGYRFDDFLSAADPIHSARTRWAIKS